MNSGLKVKPGFTVSKDDLILASSLNSFEEAKLLIEEDKRRQELSLLLKRRVIKKLLKKNIPLNTSSYKIFVEVSHDSIPDQD